MILKLPVINLDMVNQRQQNPFKNGWGVGTEKSVKNINGVIMFSIVGMPSAVYVRYQII